MQLRTTVVQLANDGFVSQALNTGLAVTGNQGYRLNQITYEIPTISYGAGANYEVALSRAAKTVTVPTLADDDVLWKDKHQFIQVTAAGAFFVDNIYAERPDEDIIIIEEQIYVLFDTAATVAINTLVIVLDVSPVKVSTDERIAILQSRLN